jgi:AbrB family looped-hinge helix DNA binding protein
MREVKTLQATGIVRRIDDLGRVVIPKEIRRTLRIREGDPLEICTDGEVILIRCLVKATRHNKCLECHHFCNGCDGNYKPCEAFEYAK